MDETIQLRLQSIRLRTASDPLVDRRATASSGLIRTETKQPEAGRGPFDSLVD